MAKSRKKLYEECRERLLKEKEAHLTEFRSYDDSLNAEVHGDDGDVASAIEGQGLAVARREKVLHDLKEIEAALERIEEGTYGVCEETDEEIEERRLLTIPWTRLSLEGALIREREEKQQRRGVM